MERGKVAVICMDLLACSLEYGFHLAHSLALVPYLTLSVSLAFPVLVRRQAAAAQHSLVHYLQHRRHLKDGLRNSVSLKRADFILDLFTLRHFQTEYNYRKGHTLCQLSIFQWPAIITGAMFGVLRQRGGRCMLAIGVTVERKFQARWGVNQY